MNLHEFLPSTALLVALTIPSASAATNGFFAPFFRGVPGTDVAGWERFTSGYNVANPPDMAGSNTGARATLTQLDPVGAVLGSGNIYVGVGGAAHFNLAYSSLAPVGQISLQIRTLGTEIDHRPYSAGGLVGRLTLGYEFLRESTIRFLVEGDAQLPFYKLTRDSDFFGVTPEVGPNSIYAPTFGVNLGIAWGGSNQSVQNVRLF